MNEDDEIKELEARLEELKRMKEKKETVQALGYYARRNCENELPTIKTMLEYIDLDNLEPEKLYGAFQQINRASFAAMRAIERDIAEKE